jgi:WD40 repeat protein
VKFFQFLTIVLFIIISQVLHALDGTGALRIENPIATFGLGTLHGTAYSPDGTLILTAGIDHPPTIWDKDTGQILQKLELPFTRQFYSLTAYDADLSDDANLVLAGYDSAAILWERSSGESKHVFQPASFPVDLSASGELAATGSSTDTARIWDVQNGELLHE